MKTSVPTVEKISKDKLVEILANRLIPLSDLKHFVLLANKGKIRDHAENGFGDRLVWDRRYALATRDIMRVLSEPVQHLFAYKRPYRKRAA
jgi:hypothetical protein